MIPLMKRSVGVSPFGVSAKRLTNCEIRLRDGAIANCVLLPLFDARGVTAKVVMVSARTRECWVLDWRPGLVQVPWLRAIRMDMPRTAPQRAAAGELLWLFDPLGLVELAMASLCGGIIARNAAAALPKTVVGLTWRRDLSRIAGVWHKKRGGGSELGGWKPDWLADADSQPPAAAPPPPAAETSARPMCGWVLRPIWTR